jgi:hypothetical protein
MKYFNCFLCIFSIFILGGCAPMYTTEYSYTPPQSPMGMMCINNCESSMRNCRQIEDLKKSNCEYRADLEYRMCNEKKDDIHCYRASCNANYENCTSDYNRCYQGCGGSVFNSQKCVAFCK